MVKSSSTLVANESNQVRINSERFVEHKKRLLRRLRITRLSKRGSKQRKLCKRLQKKSELLGRELPKLKTKSSRAIHTSMRHISRCGKATPDESQSHRSHRSRRGQDSQTSMDNFSVTELGAVAMTVWRQIESVTESLFWRGRNEELLRSIMAL